MFTALCKRRNVRLKQDRFANAITAASIYNVHRAGTDAELVTPFDFVRDAAQTEELDKVRLLKRQIRDAVTRMPNNTTREAFLKIRKNVIAGIEKLGRTDGAELWAECWPTLVPEGEEICL